MSKLTETERASLRAICDDGRQFDELTHEVRAIIDARLAPVLALADEWAARQRPSARQHAAALRAAAGTPTHHTNRGGLTVRYPLPCPYCDRVIDSMDSMSDTRAEMDGHLLSKHPDRPDPFHDPRFPS